MSKIKRLHLIVEGRVQGVGFRYHTEHEAKSLGLSGWVKNLADGSVEIIAEGDEHQLVKLLAWANKGPSHAEVSEVKSRWLDAMGELSEFKIVRE